MGPLTLMPSSRRARGALASFQLTAQASSGASKVGHPTVPVNTTPSENSLRRALSQCLTCLVFDEQGLEVLSVRWPLLPVMTALSPPPPKPMTAFFRKSQGREPPATSTFLFCGS